MTFEEFMSKVLDAFPDALVSADINGELEISTGLMFSEDGSGNIEVVPLPSENLDTP